MQALEILAEALPPIENSDHLQNLKEVYAKNGWISVHEYVETTYDIALIQSTNKKNRLLTRLKNALK
jgi:hypothetical protein